MKMNDKIIMIKAFQLFLKENDIKFIIDRQEESPACNSFKIIEADQFLTMNPLLWVEASNYFSDIFDHNRFIYSSLTNSKNASKLIKNSINSYQAGYKFVVILHDYDFIISCDKNDYELNFKLSNTKYKYSMVFHDLDGLYKYFKDNYFPDKKSEYKYSKEELLSQYEKNIIIFGGKYGNGPKVILDEYNSINWVIDSDKERIYEMINSSLNIQYDTLVLDGNKKLCCRLASNVDDVVMESRKFARGPHDSDFILLYSTNENIYIDLFKYFDNMGVNKEGYFILKLKGEFDNEQKVK